MSSIARTLCAKLCIRYFLQTKIPSIFISFSSLVLIFVLFCLILWEHCRCTNFLQKSAIGEAHCHTAAVTCLLSWWSVDTVEVCFSCTAEGGRYKSWKRRWFILNDNCLYYFQFTTVSTPSCNSCTSNSEVCHSPWGM